MGGGGHKHFCHISWGGGGERDYFFQRELCVCGEGGGSSNVNHMKM